ncbi:hypothetical protein NQ176_g8295 [Zarea fungicola]|uniref:Uncharacterized protein n=1 Tax=Zarea fungicola TaxID=93591 RepID=A0ACC1MVK4_9HYPO|nr:hypothetical protein NQ176_g8295 [Lecanicillium fungicola]
MASPIDCRPAENALETYNVQGGKQLLREYSGMADADIDAHVELIKNKGLQVAPYPCIRRFRFLDLVLSTTPIYPSVLSRVKNGAKFLDLACCLGQEIRKLVHDGAPSENTYGADLYGGFFPVGYELFDDRERLRTQFFAADIFDDDSALVENLAGKVDVVYAGDFFHLFSLEQQEAVAARIVQLLVAKKGSMLVGRHSGAERSGEYVRGDINTKAAHKHFNHNSDSWKELWTRIGERTGTEWEVDVELVPEFKFVEGNDDSLPGDKEVERLRGAKGLVYTIIRK